MSQSQTMPTPAFGPPAEPPMTYEQMVTNYRRLRDRKEEIAKRHAAELKPYNELMSELEMRLLDAMNQQGANSLSTTTGVAYKVTRISYTVEDPKEFRQYIEATGDVDLMESRVSKSALDERLKNGGTLPPGIKVSSFTTVNIRKKD
jgi:hypothetical protein